VLLHPGYKQDFLLPAADIPEALAVKISIFFVNAGIRDRHVIAGDGEALRCRDFTVECWKSWR